MPSTIPKMISPSYEAAQAKEHGRALAYDVRRHSPSIMREAPERGQVGLELRELPRPAVLASARALTSFRCLTWP